MSYHQRKLQGLTFVVLGLLITSCSAIRGYLKDGTDGPGIYSFKHHAHDTICYNKKAI